MAADTGGVDLLGSYTGAVGTINAVYTGIKMVVSTLKGAKDILMGITKHWRDIQQSAFETARAIGLSRDKAMAYDRILMESTKQLGRQYGVTYKEIAKWQEEYVTRTGKAIIMNRQQQEAIAAMSRLAGADTASQMADEMNRFGGSIGEAEFNIALIQERAKAFGLSTKTASESLAKNIHLASTYQFQKGVDGLQRMVLASQRLRINMESITNVADKFQSIEGSIEGAAKLQVLGGNFAQQFSNPMGVLYESMNDIEGLTRRIENSVKDLGTFNKETGMVDITGLNQLKVKAAAEAMGMSRQELTQIVMSKAKEGEINGAIGRNANAGEFSDAQKTLIQNKATWDAEKQTFVINQLDENGEETKQFRVDELTKDQVKLLQDSNLTEEKLWGDVHAIREFITGDFRNRARGTTSTNENIEGLASEWDAMLAQLENILMGTLGGSNLLNGANFRPWDYVKGFFANGGVVDSQKDTKPVKAQFGAMIPGNSYSGDKVPVMANSGEMIINKEQQSGLWNTLKNLGKTAAMMYAGNKIGNKLGVKGIGAMIGMHSLMTGGEASVGELAGSGIGLGVAQLVGKRMYGASATKQTQMMGSPMLPSPMLNMRSPMLSMMMGGMGMRSPMMGMGSNLTLVNPNVFMNGNVMMNGGMMLGDQLSDFGDAVGSVTENVENYGRAIKNFSNKWTGKFMKNTRPGRFLNRQVIARGRMYRMNAKSGLRSFANRKYDSFIQNTKLGQRYEYYKYQQALKPKTPNAWSRFKNSEFISDAKRVFRGGRSTSDVIKASEAASNTVSKNAVKGVSKITNAFSKMGGNKTLSVLSKGSKMLGRVGGPIGAAIGAISLASDISSASSQYREREQEIENSNMSDIEKARAKDDAVREKNGSIGGSVGNVGGALAGAAIGTAILPGIGTLIGGALGAFGGESIGKSIGGLFGGDNEKKLKEEKEKASEEKKFNAISKANGRDVEQISRTVDNIYSYLLSGKLAETHGVVNSTANVSDGVNTKVIDGKEITKNKSNIGGSLAGAAAGAAIGSVVPIIGTAIGGIIGGIAGNFGSKILSNSPIYDGVKPSKPIGEKTYIAPVTKDEVTAKKPTVPTPQSINLNVSGTIKLDGGNNNNSSINFDELIKDPVFVRKIKDMIVKSMSETENGGKQNLEGDRSNRLR